MRIAILGVGSIGSLFATRLAQTDCDLVLYARGMVSQTLASTGLVLHEVAGGMTHVPSSRWVVLEGDLTPEVSSCCDIAIICGKSGSTTELAKVAEWLLKPEGIGVTLQNGLGNASKLQAWLGIHRFLMGSTTHGAMRLSPEEVRWAGRGEIHIGAPLGSDLADGSSKVLEFLELLEQAGLDPMWAEDPVRVVWGKLLLNVAINPLAAICGVRNGEILADGSLLEQARAAMLEANTVAAAEGVEFTESELVRDLDRVLAHTSENRCSMLQDIMAGRKTEIEAICGEVVRRGEENGIPTPLNAQLLSLVRGVEGSLSSD